MSIKASEISDLIKSRIEKFSSATEEANIGTVVTVTDGITMEDLTPGRAVIIHANADNFANIPNRYTLPDGAAVPDQTTLSTGDAGGRVACAVVK